VQAQDYARVQHVVVSDGRDLELASKLLQPGQPPTGYFADHPYQTSFRFTMLPEHDPEAQWGHYARLHGIDLAKGEYIAYLDDDNSWHPDHVRLLVAALEATGAGFAYGLMAVHGRGEYVIGSDPPAEGQIDTSMIIHRRDLLETATWRWYAGIPTIDWDLVSRWMGAGATWVRVPQVTADYYFH
jgi:glycosyltransferase involved in cell wall biosynthesis